MIYISLAIIESVISLYDVTVPDFVYTVQRYISAKIRDQRDKRKIANIISKSQEHSFDNPHFFDVSTSWNGY